MKLLGIILLALSLIACNTVSGAGKDLEKASQWTRDKMSK